jgi:hypothetical protein
VVGHGGLRELIGSRSLCDALQSLSEVREECSEAEGLHGLALVWEALTCIDSLFSERSVRQENGVSWANLQ